MKIKNKTILELGAALSTTDNQPSFDFKAVYYMSRCIRKLIPHVEALGKAKTAFAIGLEGETDKAKLTDTNKQWDELMETEVDVDIEPRLTFSELNLYDPKTNKEGNKIGPKILAALQPLMVEDPNNL